MTPTLHTDINRLSESIRSLQLSRQSFLLSVDAIIEDCKRTRELMVGLSLEGNGDDQDLRDAVSCNPATETHGHQTCHRRLV